MSRTKPNYLWRATPTPRSTVDTCELQTLAYDNNTKKPEWITIARGEPTAIEMIARRLSGDRFRMFPLQAGEPGWPKEEGTIDEDEETESENTDRGSTGPGQGYRTDLEDPEGRQASPEEGNDPLSGSTSTTRRPAIREASPRQSLRGAAARSHERRKQREGGREGHDDRS